MKILHSLGSFVNGGVETLLVNVANRQIAAGHEVGIMIVTNKWSQDMLNTLDSHIKIILINKPIGSKNPWYLLKIVYLYKKYKADILHLHSPGMDKLFTSKNKGERRVITIHNETIPMPFSSNVDQYIAISQCVLDAFISKTGHDNCVVCYNGVDNKKFVVKKTYSRRPNKLLLVGRVLFEVKGQDVVLEGIAHLPDDIKKCIHLDIWGDGADMDRMKQMVSKLSLESVVSIMGNKDNDYVARHICDYDVMIQASRHEGLGISAIEAMISGVPVLVSNAKGFVEVTENGKYGQVFPHSNVDAFTIAFIEMYNSYPNSVGIAKKAIGYANEKFSLNSYVDQVMKVYS